MTQEETVLQASLRRGLILSLVIFTACVVAEERDVYLILMEGDPVAFHRGQVTTEGREEGRKLDFHRCQKHVYLLSDV